MKEKEDLNALLRMLMVVAQTHATANTKLRGSLNGSLNYLKKLAKEISTLKVDLDKTSNQYFERIRNKYPFIPDIRFESDGLVQGSMRRPNSRQKGGSPFGEFSLNDSRAEDTLLSRDVLE